MQHSYVIRGNVHIVYLFIVHAHRDPGNSRQFKGASKLLAQGRHPYPRKVRR